MSDFFCTFAHLFVRRAYMTHTHDAGICALFVGKGNKTKTVRRYAQR